MPHFRPMHAAILLVLLFVASTSRGVVKVEKAPPDVERKTFDPADPPKDLPHVKGGETAITTYNFECGSNFGVRQTQRQLAGDKWRTTLVVNTITLKITLKVVIWIPKDATAKLKAHEEGHRLIAERMYTEAESAIKTVAAKIDGRRYDGDGIGLDNADKKAQALLEAASHSLNDSYFKIVADPTHRIQDIYDELTSHGQNARLAEADAIKQAFDRYAAEAAAAKGNPTTAPTTRPAGAKPATRATARP